MKPSDRFALGCGITFVVGVLIALELVIGLQSTEWWSWLVLPGGLVVWVAFTVTALAFGEWLRRADRRWEERR